MEQQGSGSCSSGSWSAFGPWQQQCVQEQLHAPSASGLRSGGRQLLIPAAASKQPVGDASARPATGLTAASVRHGSESSATVQRASVK